MWVVSYLMSFQTLKLDWFSNIRNDVLAGLVVALALIPEAIAFSIIAGLTPRWACTLRSLSLPSSPSLEGAPA